jgi:hypothetical protein
MDIEHRLELLITHRVYPAVPGVACVVHNDVQAVIVGRRVGDQLVAGVRSRQVGDERRGGVRAEFLVEFSDCFVGLGLVDVCDHDLGAVGRQ